MKYIHHPALGILIFEDHVAHRDYAAKLGCMPLSAGMVRHRPDGTLECYGKSDSLGLAAHPSDTTRVNAFMRPPLGITA